MTHYDTLKKFKLLIISQMTLMTHCFLYTPILLLHFTVSFFLFPCIYTV